MPGAAARTERRRLAGFSLLELLLVISLMAVFAGLMIPDSTPGIHEQLQSAARMVAADMAYCRSLAVTHGSYYRVRFEEDDTRYVIEHFGGDSALDALPASPFRNRGDPSNQHVVDLDELPQLGPSVHVHAVVVANSASTPVTTVEFGPLGGTTRPQPTVIWLSAGQTQSQRYVTLQVNPITGLTTIGDYSAQGLTAESDPPTSPP